MADILKTYTSITASYSATRVTDVFDNIINAPPFTFDKSTRLELIQAILKDLKSAGSKGRITPKDAARGLLAVKSLGRDPAGSACLATSSNLSALLGFAATFKDDPDAVSESLRCIANALLLIEGARSTFTSKEVNGGEICISMLEKTSSPDQIFILSRTLFLSTASSSPVIETMVDAKYNGRSLVDILGAKLDSMIPAIRASAPTSKEAMIDLLKFTFNILLHYPKITESETQHSGANPDEKVAGDYWNSKLDPILPPLLRVFRDLPASSPAPIQAPLTHAIHCLITIPISPSTKHIWLGQAPPSRGRNSPVVSPISKSPSESSGASRNSSPSRSAPSPTSTKASTIDRALSKLAAAGRSLSRTPSPSIVVALDILQRSYDLLSSALSHYFPGTIECDDPSILSKQKAESALDTLDDLISPLIVLIARLCTADESCRIRLRQWMIPDNLDRSSPLEQRADSLGRCLRLLMSVYHPRLRDSVGEMLFAACDSDAHTLCALVGYGNVAGYLFNKGILTAPPPADATTSTASSSTVAEEDLDPITGMKRQPKPALDMTEEEQEREMEKLFVLFDRLEKNGAIPPDQNPMRKAIQKRMS
ncbi:hypothetical protein D9619_000863 [Psilocybe cf. subviscida]|uniref:Synembryn-A n=1 Tax=Psilocybe cf. subviscida TaxID=2480587 RepID=A0A8H5BID6_9AGAR|nr:hypothetical protein D9619_000863 [Psilocybe cf. subviscida]